MSRAYTQSGTKKEESEKKPLSEKPTQKRARFAYTEQRRMQKKRPTKMIK